MTATICLKTLAEGQGRVAFGDRQMVAVTFFRARLAGKPYGAYAVSIRAAAWRPSSSMLISRMRNFWILPVTVIGKCSTNFQ